MTKVTQLKLQEAGPVDDVVHILQHWLLLAKKGEIRAVMLYGDMKDGSCRRTWKGEYSYESFVYGATLLQHSLLAEARTQDEVISPTEEETQEIKRAAKDNTPEEEDEKD